MPTAPLLERVVTIGIHQCGSILVVVYKSMIVVFTRVVATGVGLWKMIHLGGNGGVNVQSSGVVVVCTSKMLKVGVVQMLEVEVGMLSLLRLDAESLNSELIWAELS